MVQPQNPHTAKPGSRLLIVDDDSEFATMLTKSLSAEGFMVDCVQGALEAIERMKRERFDLLILDVMMPNMSGLDLMRRLRPACDIPVLMLTARGDDVDRILGLELGADDYLAKPFHPRELVARIRAILRRSEQKSAKRDSLSVGPLTIDPARLSVSLAGKPVRLTVAEFLVLEVLMRAEGRMIARAALTEQALGRPLEEYDRSINTHVSNLRRKLGLDGTQALQIRSVRNAGYMLVVGEDD